MGSCCCCSNTSTADNDRTVEEGQTKGGPPIKPYKDLPSIPPAVYIHLAIPKELLSDKKESMDSSHDVSMQEPLISGMRYSSDNEAVDYDKLMTDLSIVSQCNNAVDQYTYTCISLCWIFVDVL